MITIKIEKDTPEEVMSATALFINELKGILHGEDKITESESEVQTESITIASSEPVPVGVIPVAPKADVFIPPAPVVPEAPVNIAPIVPAVPEVATANTGLEIDAVGMSWDKRIHSRGKSKNADGTWRRKRGISEELIKQVEAENKNADLSTDTLVPEVPIAPAVIPPVPLIPAPVAVGVAPVANPFAVNKGAGSANSGTVAPAVPPVPQAPSGVGRSYSDLESLISQLILSGQTDGNKVMAVCAANNLAAVTLLKDADPAIIGKVYDEIKAGAS